MFGGGREGRMMIPHTFIPANMAGFEPLRPMPPRADPMSTPTYL